MNKGERGRATASWETKKGACSSLAYSRGRRRRAKVKEGKEDKQTVALHKLVCSKSLGAHLCCYQTTSKSY
jgi:hypothetical protein